MTSQKAPANRTFIGAERAYRDLPPDVQIIRVFTDRHDKGNCFVLAWKYSFWSFYGNNYELTNKKSRLF